VDFVKAFDCIEHLFIKSVFEFFNYGPRFVNMITTLLKDRRAQIILNNGFSDSFAIQRGSPQGDRVSPYLFILCIEILLIKIRSVEGGGDQQLPIYS
jgi:hypothetical protein